MSRLENVSEFEANPVVQGDRERAEFLANEIKSRDSKISSLETKVRFLESRNFELQCLIENRQKRESNLPSSSCKEGHL